MLLRTSIIGNQCYWEPVTLGTTSSGRTTGKKLGEVQRHQEWTLGVVGGYYGGGDGGWVTPREDTGGGHQGRTSGEDRCEDRGQKCQDGDSDVADLYENSAAAHQGEEGHQLQLP